MQKKESFGTMLAKWFVPNERTTAMGRWLIAGIWIGVLILFLGPAGPRNIPNLIEIYTGFGPVIERGFFNSWLSTLSLTFQAIGLSVVFAFLIAYLSIMPFFRPLAFFISKLRFLSLVGFVVLFMQMAGSNVHGTRLMLLMFGVVPYLTTSMLSTILSTDRSMFDYAKSLGLNAWQTTWHVLIAGKAGEVMDGIRQNLAIAFTMIVYVESTLREGGGIGALLQDTKKYAHSDGEIYAIQISVFAVGIALDFIFHEINKVAFPYAFIKRKRES